MSNVGDCSVTKSTQSESTRSPLRNRLHRDSVGSELPHLFKLSDVVISSLLAHELAEPVTVLVESESFAVFEQTIDIDASVSSRVLDNHLLKVGPCHPLLMNR